MTAGLRRHYISVLRPSSALNGRGQIEGEPEVVYRALPAEIRTLSTREQEIARQNYALASHQVTVWPDPAKPITELDHVAIGGRRLEVGSVNDVRQTGIELVLICGEVKANG